MFTNNLRTNEVYSNLEFRFCHREFLILPPRTGDTTLMIDGWKTPPKKGMTLPMYPAQELKTNRCFFFIQTAVKQK